VVEEEVVDGLDQVVSQLLVLGGFSEWEAKYRRINLFEIIIV
jgi:hypothetical protein